MLNLVWIKMSEKIEKKCNFYPPNHAVASSILQFRPRDEAGFGLNRLNMLEAVGFFSY